MVPCSNGALFWIEGFSNLPQNEWMWIITCGLFALHSFNVHPIGCSTLHFHLTTLFYFLLAGCNATLTSWANFDSWTQHSIWSHVPLCNVASGNKDGNNMQEQQNGLRILSKSPLNLSQCSSGHDKLSRTNEVELLNMITKCLNPRETKWEFQMCCSTHKTKHQQFWGMLAKNH